MIKRIIPAANSSPFLLECKKKLVKSPKVCLTDSGILHYLVVVTDFNNLSGNLVIGNSWESFAFNQIISIKRAQTGLWFYRTHHDAEVDLVFTRGMNVVATAEIKYSSSPQLTKGNFQAIEDLNSPNNFIITPSSDDYLLKESLRVCSLKALIFNYLPVI